MARIVEFRSSEQPHMSITESMYYRLAEPLVFRDLDGVLGDIVAACCRRCGEVTLRSDEVANHLCISSERTDRLVAKGIGVFREIVARKDTEAALPALQQRVERLTGALLRFVRRGEQLGLTRQGAQAWVCLHCRGYSYENLDGTEDANGEMVYVAPKGWHQRGCPVAEARAALADAGPGAGNQPRSAV